MKIGIFTLPLVHNYGGILQAYALQSFLRSNGHDAWVIMHRRERTKASLFILDIKRLVQRYLLGNKNIEPFAERNRLITNKYINAFMDKELLPFTKNFYLEGFKDFEKYGFDAVVVGSDQVWRLEYIKSTHGQLGNYFLDFIKDPKVKKIAYAASFGIDTWAFSEAETNLVKSLIKDFEMVSVRENSAVGLCREYLETDALHLIDPTMLLDAHSYNRLIDTCEYKLDDDPNCNIFTYMLDTNSEKQSVIREVESVLGYKSYTVHNSKMHDVYLSPEERIAPPIQNWLEGFRTSKYVVTDSFHGSVFSILYNKPFIIFGNKKRGMARFDSLLKMFNLEDRIIYSKEDLTNEIITKPIDWNKVNDILTVKRAESFNFLEKALK